MPDTGQHTKKIIHTSSLIFGEGEMSSIIRTKDWSKTTLGPINTWPQRLLGIVNILLESKFPQFLFWGPENICFYNDDYAPSLGEAFNHSSMMGISAPEFWGDVWYNFAKEQVTLLKSGAPATWFEDQLVPIHRNGRWEDVYWTFTYSPVRSDDGVINGVLVTVIETTEKVVVFKELEENRDQLEFALDAASLASFEWRPSENKFDGNTTLKRWFNLASDDEINIDDAINNIKREDQPRVRAAIAHALDPETSPEYDIIYTIEAAGAQPRIVRAIGKAYFDTDSKPVRFNGVIQDITKEHRSEREQRKLLALVDTSSEFIFVTNLDGLITSANPMARAYLDVSETKGSNVKNYIFPEDLPVAKTLLSKLKTQDRFFSEIRFWNRKTGKVFWMLCNASAIKDPSSDNLTAIAITASNITIQKEKEALLEKSLESLRESENRFKLLANNAPAFIRMSDMEGNVTFANKLFAEFLGVTNEYLRGKTLFKYVHPKDRERCEAVYREASKNKEQYKLEFRAKNKDGLYRWMSDIAVPRFDGNDNFEGYTHAGLIIHELKVQEKQKDLFIGMVSHELKTPVTSIKGYVQLLKMKYGKSKDPFLVKTLNTVNSQILVLTALITDLLDLSKMKSGGLRLNVSKINFDEFLSDIIAQQEMINSDHTFNCSNDYHGTIEADKDRLAQVLINFLSNAVKYAPGSKNIDITAVTKNNKLVVSVRDYGIGINTSNQDKVFKRFFREEGTDEKTFPGFGIGLYIAADIIKKHHGKIGVSSVKGQGATFYFKLPLIN
ncbi:PAS domain S-box protein [Dokdonia donghaensis]|uniref:PAS domain S-box protein n=1 Tax=Dokdonia donghaensis TaxID=326320 RepID=UPI00068FC7F4|nr:PAS domain S-box protein [Dokdonia donghaensis]ANH60259.1 Sensor protein kinase WalK [Dokdonia donghaensis DSW-1]